MYILNTDTIEAVCNESIIDANSLISIVHFKDETSSTTTPNRQRTALNGTTQVTILSTPSVGGSKIIDSILLVNLDIVSHITTIKHVIGGNESVLFKANIPVGGKLIFTRAAGWQLFDTNGYLLTANVINASGPLANNKNVTVLTGDIVNNNAVANTLQDVTGLFFTPTINKVYAFKFFGFYDAAATTTGSRYVINAPTNDRLATVSRYALTAATETLNYANSLLAPAASNATSGLTSGNIFIIEGFVRLTSSGNVQLQFASEVANSAITVKAGSYCEYWEAV